MKRLIALGLLLLATPALAQQQQPFDVEAATRAYLALLSPEARAKSDAYFEGGYWLILWGFLVTVGANWLVLKLGWAAKWSAWASRRSARPAARSLLWALPYIGVTALLTLPWAIYTGFVREHQYGLATQSFGPWFGEQLLSFVISSVVLALIIVGLLALFRRIPRAWWAVGAAVTIVFMAFFATIAPIFIEPLFNTYAELPAGEVRDETLAMARANGVPADNVYLVDASRQTTRISANVAGMFGTTRIALNDNLLNSGSPAQVRAVMGHELGHYVLNHIWSLLLVFGLLILGAYLLVHLAAPRLIAGERWGVKGLDDPAIVPVAAILIAAWFLLMTPVTNSLVRTHEMEADVFGLNAARAPDGFARIALKLSTYRKIDPSPLEEAIFYDHPSGRTRIETAMRWKAEHLGEPGVE